MRHEARRLPASGRRSATSPATSRSSAAARPASAIAVDAASRGYDVALFEQADFAKGTSSRSTKLVHGGVRYLQQGNVALVMEALRERGYPAQNAPHLVHDLALHRAELRSGGSRRSTASG